MKGKHARTVVDRALLLRAFAVLGSTEALAALAAFAIVLVHGGWRWGEEPGAGLLALASGTAFAAIAVAQMANAFVCRSTTLPVWRLHLFSNRLLLMAVAAEAALLGVFLGLPRVAHLLGGSWPSPRGWALAACAAVAVVVVDGVVKTVLSRRRQRG